MIDAVITWVDGSDPAHAAKLAAHKGKIAAHSEATEPTRFASSGELRFAVLSVLRFCPFVRRVYVVTDAQYPAPLKPLMEDVRLSDWLRIVDHRDVFGEHADLLPVFSSRSIEIMLHRIPGLAERFLYLNDDIFIGRPMREQDYFDGDRPILRGTMRRFPNPLLRRLRKVVRPPHPGYGSAQRAAAQLTRRRRDYLLLEHQPQPMRRSTLAAYYTDDPASLRVQAGHRFRSADQVSSVSLAAHLEIARGASVVPPLDIGYARPGRPTGMALGRMMNLLNQGAFASFCVQSLDLMSDEDRATVFDGLVRYYA